MGNELLLSICVIAYNQKDYIRECLNSIFMQKTNFKYEVLIHDDASTDGTADIIREYEHKYPDIIKPIYQTENQHSKGIAVAEVFNFPRIKGKYFALLEGDDYWTDTYKLQKQIDFMEDNLEYSICFHNTKVIHEPKVLEDYIYPKDKYSTYDFDNLLIANFISTSSVLYRTTSYPEFWKDFPKNILPCDWYLHLMFANKGKIKFLDETMSVYRRTPSGIWNDTAVNYRKHVLQYCFKEANMHYLVYKNIAKNKKNYFIKYLFLFFLVQQYNILASGNILLFIKYNQIFYKIHLICLKYWYCIPFLIIEIIIKLFKRNILKNKEDMLKL